MDPGRSSEVVVIGAGAIGCAIAWRLAQTGRSVAIIDRGEPGAEASRAAAGILGAQMESHEPGPLLELQLASRALHPAFAAELLDATGVDVRCRIDGVLELAFSEAEVRELAHRFEAQRAAALEANWFDQQQLRENASIGAPPEALAGLLFPRDGQVDNRALGLALRLAAEKAGARILCGEALELIQAEGRVTGLRWRELFDAKAASVRDSERILGCDAAVIAAGSWSTLLPGAGLAEGAVRPVRGQMISVAEDLERTALHPDRVLSCSAGYAVPRGDRVLFGATVEEAGFDKRLTEQGMRAMESLIAKLRPELLGQPILERWSGLRPRSRDGLPLLGAPRDAPAGLFVSTGHYRSGILLTPISAQLLCETVLGRAPSLDLAPFRPDRESLR